MRPLALSSYARRLAAQDAGGDTLRAALLIGAAALVLIWGGGEYIRVVVDTIGGVAGRIPG